MNAKPSRNQYYEEIRDEYQGLAVGVSHRGLCPACGGGQSQEPSLSVTRNDSSILFICHRAGCGIKGRVSVLGGSVDATIQRPAQRISGRHRYNALGKSPLPRGVVAYLQTHYSLSQDEIARAQLHWTTDYSVPGRGRVVMPVLDSKGVLYGFTARSLDGQSPKTLSFIEDSHGAWYRKQGSNDLLIVEDQLSAVRASRYVNSCALLGTNMPVALEREIIRWGFNRVFLALDRDAYTKSLKMVMDRPALAMQAPQLPKDIKNMTPDEVESWLNHEGIV